MSEPADYAARDEMGWPVRMREDGVRVCARPVGRQAVTVHELKCWRSFFASILDGSKPFECRWDDRGFKAGDVLHLCETPEGGDGYTGRQALADVLYVLRDFAGLVPGWVVMGIRLRKDEL